MRIVYMGTPDIAVPTLQMLAAQEEVVGVFTQPDRPKGRGHRTVPTPVKAAAQALNLPVFQLDSLRRGEQAQAALEMLRSLAPELIVVMAYGQILPPEVLALPPHGCINLHASLLPAYRGAAPIQWVILNGETRTGITSMQMAEGLDTGDMLVKEMLEIGGEETAQSLHDRLAALAPQVMQQTLEQLKSGTLHPQPQDDALSSYAVRITKEMSALDFTRTAQALHDQIRAITGYTAYEGRRLKFYTSRVLPQQTQAAPGTILDAQQFTVACGGGTILQIGEIQPEGKKRMAAQDFLRGYPIEEGKRLG